MELKKNRIHVEIAGTRFTVLSTETDEYTSKIASELTSEITLIRKAAPGLSLSSATMLAALNYCDKASKAQTDADMLRAQVKEYLSDCARYRADYEEVSIENEKLKKDIEMLRKRLGEKGRTPVMPAPVSRTVKKVQTDAQIDETAEEITDFFEKFESK